MDPELALGNLRAEKMLQRLGLEDIFVICASKYGGFDSFKSKKFLER
mgnify:CR=1 FL=1